MNASQFKVDGCNIVVRASVIAPLSLCDVISQKIPRRAFLGANHLLDVSHLNDSFMVGYMSLLTQLACVHRFIVNIYISGTVRLKCDWFLPLIKDINYLQHLAVLLKVLVSWSGVDKGGHGCDQGRKQLRSIVTRSFLLFFMFSAT